MKNNIDKTIIIKARGEAEFSIGGWTSTDKTMSDRTRWFKKNFCSKDKKNFVGENIILPN